MRGSGFARFNLLLIGLSSLVILSSSTSFIRGSGHHRREDHGGGLRIVSGNGKSLSEFQPQHEAQKAPVWTYLIKPTKRKGIPQTEDKGEETKQSTKEGKSPEVHLKHGGKNGLDKEIIRINAPEPPSINSLVKSLIGSISKGGFNAGEERQLGFGTSGIGGFGGDLEYFALFSLLATAFYIFYVTRQAGTPGPPGPPGPSPTGPPGPPGPPAPAPTGRRRKRDITDDVNPFENNFNHINFGSEDIWGEVVHRRRKNPIHNKALTLSRKLLPHFHTIIQTARGNLPLNCSLSPICQVRKILQDELGKESGAPIAFILNLGIGKLLKDNPKLSDSQVDTLIEKAGSHCVLGCSNLTECKVPEITNKGLNQNFFASYILEHANGN